MSLFLGTWCQDPCCPWSSMLTRKQFPGLSPSSGVMEELWPGGCRGLLIAVEYGELDGRRALAARLRPRLGPLDLLAGGVHVLLALLGSHPLLAASQRCPHRRVRLEFVERRWCYTEDGPDALGGVPLFGGLLHPLGTQTVGSGEQAENGNVQSPVSYMLGCYRGQEQEDRQGVRGISGMKGLEMPGSATSVIGVGSPGDGRLRGCTGRPHPPGSPGSPLCWPLLQPSNSAAVSSNWAPAAVWAVTRVHGAWCGEAAASRAGSGPGLGRSSHLCR